MDIWEWMEAMGIKELKHWIQSQLGPTRLEAISQKAIHLLQVLVRILLALLNAVKLDTLS